MGRAQPAQRDLRAALQLLQEQEETQQQQRQSDSDSTAARSSLIAAQQRLAGAQLQLNGSYWRQRISSLLSSMDCGSDVDARA